MNTYLKDRQLEAKSQQIVAAFKTLRDMDIILSEDSSYGASVFIEYEWNSYSDIPRTHSVRVQIEKNKIAKILQKEREQLRNYLDNEVTGE